MRNRASFAGWAVAVALAGQSPPPPSTPPVSPATPPAGSVVTPPQVASPAGGGVVVIDPGHGGTDAGARGAGGLLEKDVVMNVAQALRTALERQGLRVLMTRGANDNPNFDDRAAMANGQRGAIVVSLHAASTGTPGAARAYYLEGEPVASDMRPGSLVNWEEAQRPHVAASRKLAELIQLQIKQRLEKSAATAAAARLRDIRSVNAPAVAVELASVSVSDRKALDPHLAPLAEAIARGVQAFRAATPGGGMVGQ